MTRLPDAMLIDALAADTRPVRPLAPPLKRAAATLAAVALVGAAAVLAAANLREFRSLHAGREVLLALEMAAALATGVLAITAAFFASVPGRSRRCSLAPLPFLAAWLLLSGVGCYRELVAGGAGTGSFSGHPEGNSQHCVLFILGVSALLAPPIIWRLGRAAPLEPLSVALLGGLGIAALSAFLLQFFHPFTVTFLDLGMHLIAVLLVIGVAGVLNRRTLVGSQKAPK
ncbi:NrsF family protein [uncultured Sphingomonas sp.]|uniref:NrsF family protein n=1 Tax=uncultured Sphingomonas sp. TaxID=158754 RepID=UPI0025D5C937|nr:NrsF family protein [uncultured Sphingomonas sp.]